MKISIGALLFLAALSLLPIACNNNSNPSYPSNPPAPAATFTSTNTPCASCTPTFTPTVTFTSSPTFTPTATATSGINWLQGEIYYSNTIGVSIYQSADLWLEVNGSPEQTATVYLTGSGVGATPVTLPWNSNQTDFGKTWAVYQLTSGWTYQPGQTYQMTSITSAGTAYSTMTVAPGNITYLTNAGAVTQIVWTVEGNHDGFQLNDNGSPAAHSGPPDIDSPFNFPASSEFTNSGHTYNLEMTVMNNNIGITNVTPGSAFDIQEKLTNTYVKP